VTGTYVVYQKKRWVSNGLFDRRSTVLVIVKTSEVLLLINVGTYVVYQKKRWVSNGLKDRNRFCIDEFFSVPYTYKD